MIGWLLAADDALDLGVVEAKGEGRFAMEEDGEEGAGEVLREGDRGDGAPEADRSRGGSRGLGELVRVMRRDVYVVWVKLKPLHWTFSGTEE